MRVVILTTQTPHHLAFVRSLAQSHPIEQIVLETSSVKPPFPVAHPFEARRDEYEWETWFGDQRPEMGDFADTISVQSANDRGCVNRLSRLAPDVMISFGTGKLSPDVIGLCPGGALNLHGGDPERYRGLDSHLWSIYHRDPSGLVTTLHRLNDRLDDGEIIQRKPVIPPPASALFELRRYNTEICIELTRDALTDFSRRQCFNSTPQQKIGRYYSFMPAVLKDLCATRFPSFMKSLA